MSWMIIYLVLPLPAASSDLPESSPGRLKRFLLGLASNGVYMCPVRYRTGGSLLHCLSTLTPWGAVYFCCTILGVASTGRYPASCPAKPGLSSPALWQPRSFILLDFFLLSLCCCLIPGSSCLRWIPCKWNCWEHYGCQFPENIPKTSKVFSLHRIQALPQRCWTKAALHTVSIQPVHKLKQN